MDDPISGPLYSYQIDSTLLSYIVFTIRYPLLFSPFSCTIPELGFGLDRMFHLYKLIYCSASVVVRSLIAGNLVSVATDRLGVGRVK